MFPSLSPRSPLSDKQINVKNLKVLKRWSGKDYDYFNGLRTHAHIYLSFSLQSHNIDAFPEIHSIFLILLSLLPMILYHCVLSSTIEMVPQAYRELSPAITTFSSKFSTDSLMDPGLLTWREASCREGDSTLT